MTFANDGFFSSQACFILTTSHSSPSQPGMQPCTGTHTWSPDLWAHYYTPNRCTAVSKHHDSPTFDPPCTYATARANLAPSTEDLKHIYPSPPHTDSDPKHTVPLPTVSEDSPSHAEGTSTCPHSRPLTLPCPPTPLTQVSEGPFTSQPSTQDLLPLSPPPSLPMVPHALPEATTSCYTLDRLGDARDDADVEPDTPDNESQSSSSPDEAPPSDLLTPLSPMWDLPLDDDDTRPAGILEVSTLLSRPLVSSPLPRLPAPAVQTTEGDRTNLPCRSNPTKWDLDSRVESQCVQLRPYVVPPDGLAGTRFTMFQTFFPPPAFDGLPSDGFIGHSYPSSGGKLFIDTLLSETGSPYILPKLTLVAQPSQLQRRISLPSPSPEEPPTDTLVSCYHGTGTPQPSGGATEMPCRASANSSPVSHNCTELSVATTSLSQWDHPSTPEVASQSPVEEFWPPSPSTSVIVASGSSVASNPGPITVEGINSFNHAPSDWDNIEQDVVPPSPSHRAMSDVDDLDDESSDEPAPSSPSRRSFADLPDTTTDDHLISPAQSPLLSRQSLLTLPGAEPDDSLITAETSVSDWSSPSPPRGLGLFLPIQAASSNQFQASEPHPIEPNLNFSHEAVARVDSREFEKLKSVRRRTWVSERKAKEDEVYHAKRAEHLASRLSVAPPVPSKLADFDERGGVSAGADAGETEGPPGEPAQLDESDEKTIRTWLLFTEARRADARRLRKREKELGRELQALLCLKLGEDPHATDGSVQTVSEGAKVKPGKTAIVSMPQLVARMIMKRHDTPRLFSPRKHDTTYIDSPLSRFEPTAGDSGYGFRGDKGCVHGAAHVVSLFRSRGSDFSCYRSRYGRFSYC